MNTANFSKALLAWHRQGGRHDLPWQHPRSPYRVWVSEIMLQQTQVRTVIGYFENFMARFPTLADLAQAPESEVMHAWAGLGYYSRARNLQRTAKQCVELHDGELPCDFEALLALPGIGRSTAGAILSQAHGERFAIVDGNVKRVLSRCFGVAGDPASHAVNTRFWALAESLLPQTNMADYSQAIMDLGATVCKRNNPICSDCPMHSQCIAYAKNATALYPERKRRKTLPQREVFVLLLGNSNAEMLLQQRPAKGIWGGLHSLPEAESIDSAQAFAQRWASGLGMPQELPEIKHSFSHYHLRIRPLQWQNCSAKARIGDNADMQWFSASAMHALGLPTPIKKLLENLP